MATTRSATNPLTALAALNRPRQFMAAPPIIPAQSPSAVPINAGGSFQTQQNFANSMVRQQKEELAKMALQKQDQGAALHMQGLANQNANALRQSADSDARERLVIANTNARDLAGQKAKTEFDNANLLMDADIEKKRVAAELAWKARQEQLGPQAKVIGEALKNLEKWDTGGDVKWQEAARNQRLMEFATRPDFQARMEGRYTAKKNPLARPSAQRDKNGLPSADYLNTISKEITDNEVQDILKAVAAESRAMRENLSRQADHAYATMGKTGAVPIFPTAGTPLVPGAGNNLAGYNPTPGLAPMPQNFSKGITPSANLLDANKIVTDLQGEVDEAPESFMGRLGQNMLAPFEAAVQPVKDIIEAYGINPGNTASAIAALVGGRAGSRAVTDINVQKAAGTELDRVKKLAERSQRGTAFGGKAPKPKSAFNQKITYTPPGTGAAPTSVSAGNVPVNELLDKKLSSDMEKANKKLAAKLKVEMPKFDPGTDSHTAVRSKIYESAKADIQKTLDKKWGTRLKEILIKKPSPKKGKISKMLSGTAAKTGAIAGGALSLWALADAFTDVNEKAELVKDLKEAISKHDKLNRMETEEWIKDARNHLATTQGLTPADIQQIEARIAEEEKGLGTPLVP